jgi:hypothetical protein
MRYLRVFSQIDALWMAPERAFSQTYALCEQLRGDPDDAISPSAQPTASTALRLVVVDFEHTQAVDVPVGVRGSQSPDGSRIFTAGQVLTIGGDPVGTVKAATKAAWHWADDSRHLCSTYFDSPTTGPFSSPTRPVLPNCST